jgi:hypothetical protein
LFFSREREKLTSVHFFLHHPPSRTSSQNSRPGDTWLYFLFRPPWVRAKTTDVFFSLFPEKRVLDKK